MILGQEATTRTGHWLALGLDPGQVVEWRYDVRDDAMTSTFTLTHQVSHPSAPSLPPTQPSYGALLTSIDATPLCNSVPRLG